MKINNCSNTSIPQAATQLFKKILLTFICQLEIQSNSFINFHFEGLSLPCGGPQRGECKEVILNPHEALPKFPKNLEVYDDRLNWPTYYFRYVCYCKPTFRGFGCHECQFDRKGENCTQPVRNVRKDVLSLTDQELEKFKDGLLQAKKFKFTDYKAVNSLRNNGSRYSNMNAATVPCTISWQSHQSMAFAM